MPSARIFRILYSSRVTWKVSLAAAVLCVLVPTVSAIAGQAVTPRVLFVTFTIAALLPPLLLSWRDSHPDDFSPGDVHSSLQWRVGATPARGTRANVALFMLIAGAALALHLGVRCLAQIGVSRLVCLVLESVAYAVFVSDVVLFSYAQTRVAAAAVLKLTGRSSGRNALFAAIPNAARAVGLVALAVIVAVLMQRTNDPQRYATAPATTRHVQLEGLDIELAPDTRILVRYSPDHCSAVLIAGEAFFTVRHDPHRLFEVRVRDRAIRDIGTEFNVRALPDADAEVSVASGTVAISGTGALELKEGEAARLPRDVSLAPHVFTADEARRKLAWHQGTLEFAGEPLSWAVAEMNRFRSRKLIIGDPSIAGRGVGGALDPKDDESIVRVLAYIGVRHRVVRYGGVEEIHLYGKSGQEDPRREPSPF